MAMLAEPRRKQRWTLNPRGKQWSDDSNKFGQKMLEKMGWSSGKGLGRNLDGMTEHIRARFKNDQGGVGYSNEDQDKQWTQHQEGFNELLQKLQGNETAEPIPKENELSGKSLELKSQQSRARVHYKKFTRGKDVNKYSTKDLANIFGKKDLSEKQDDPATVKQEIKKDSEETISDAVGTDDSSHGVLTIKGGSIADYFKNKMASLGRKVTSLEMNDVKNEPESEDERYVGFGFAGSTSKTDNSTMKTENYTFVNQALEPESLEKMSVTPGKRKSVYVFENPALQLDDSPIEMERTPKRRKSEFVYENGGADLGLTNADALKTPNSKKNYETPDESAKNEELLLNTESVESGSKKKRRKRSKEITVVNEGFVNEALNLETRENVDDMATISQFEIPRPPVGLANDALDLSDESSTKKRVTFNDTVEYDTNDGKTRGKKRKNKNAAKLDKFEVDNEKLKKKRKKEKSLDSVATESAFTNEAMEFEVVSQEAAENALNERKMERVRRKRRMSNLETIEEAPEEDKEELTVVATEIVTLDDSLVGEANESFEIMSLDVPKDKKKKKKKSRREDETLEKQNVSCLVDESPNDVEFIEEIESTKTKDEKKPKKHKDKKELKEEEPIEMEVTINAEDIGKKKKKRKKQPTTNEAYVIEVIEDMNESIKQPQEEKTKTKNKEKSKKSVDKENVEVIFQNTEIPEPEKKRKKKQKKRLSTEKEETEEKASSTGENVAENDLNAQDTTLEIEAEVANGDSEVHSPWDNRGKISKKIFKTLFMRSPVVHFAGSNINEIKGYGVDFN